MISDAFRDQFALLPERVSWHILLTITALLIGASISIPLAIISLHLRRFRGIILSLVSIVQTIPSLALLALMVVIFSKIGFIPAIVALVLYSMLPIVRNTITGLVMVNPKLIEAGKGVGMTQWQLLTRVQFPLSLPMIIAGIRTAAVWVCGIATLSTPVGQKSLGNYIFEGLQLRNHTAVLFGIVSAALLAITLDLLIHLIEVAQKNRSKILLVSSIGSILLLGGLSFVPLNHNRSAVVVGSKTFTEQYILADMINQRFNDAGIPSQKTQGMGSSILFDALAAGNIDCYVDYSGTIWNNIMKQSDSVSAEQMIESVTRFLKDRYGIVCLGKLGFENTYALAMRKDQSRSLGITTISDLAAHAGSLTIAGDYEFFGRPEWTRVREIYGLRFKDTLPMNSTLMYAAVQSGQVEVITAFSTDGRISANDLIVLKDTSHAFPPYDAILLVSAKASKKPEIIRALTPLIDSIDDQSMRTANQSVDVDGKSPGDASNQLSKVSAKFVLN